MYLANFLDKLFNYDGFILIDSNSNKFVIGKPLKEKPIELKLLGAWRLSGCKVCKYHFLLSKSKRTKMGTYQFRQWY